MKIAIFVVAAFLVAIATHLSAERLNDFPPSHRYHDLS